MSKITPGKNNLISDVGSVKVGNVTDDEIKTGVTAIICDQPAVAAVHVMGGAPGTRETDLLAPENIVEQVDALILSGGSAFGLDAASGALAAMKEAGRGFEIGEHRVPLVPAAILFDLINGGNKDWGQYPPYREMGYEAVKVAVKDFAIGSCGAGTGALTAACKGGLGSASSIIETGAGAITIGAIVAANPLGSPVIGDSGHFWASPFEIGDEFGGLGPIYPLPDDTASLKIKHRELLKSGSNTTIAVIATDAVLSVSQAKRLAIATHDGFARAIWPSHTPLDGDLVFCLATGEAEITPDLETIIDMGAVASATMARAIARGVFAADSRDNDLMACWREKFQLTD